MKTAALIGIAVIGGAAATGIGMAAFQNETLNNSGYADVVNVKPIVERWQEPKQECGLVTVTHQKPIKDEKRIAGTAIGATIGGVLGHQVGGGSGKDVATVGGAIVGGIAGNKIQQKNQQNSTYTTVEEQCHTVMESKQRTTGYTVTYRFKEQESTIEMASRPGERLVIEDGAVVF